MKLALVIEKDDEPYLPYIKPLLATHPTSIIDRPVTTAAELHTRFDGVITTREDLLRKLIYRDGRVSIDNYAGSLLERGGKPFLILNPLRDLVTTPPGVFLAKRYVRKITHPSEWFAQSEFTWELADEVTIASIFDRLSDADWLATDIETTIGEPHCIKCVAYCMVKFSGNNFSTHTIVLPYTSMFWVHWVRKINQLPNIKVFQNGLFDNFYFERFSSPVNNWLLDTLEMFHCWYSELPKSLDYITLFLLRNSYYWKDEADSGDLNDLYQYNAKDAWATANSMLALLSEMPAYAYENYKIKFPLVFLCHACSFEGLKVDKTKVDQDPKNTTSLYTIENAKVESSLISLRKKIGKDRFNPASPKQVLQLIHLLGCKEFANADKKVLQKVAKKHPLNNMLVEEILKYRKAKKLVSTYLGADLWNDRLLYNLYPSGTDTGRLSSRKSIFHDFGAQIQNIPPYAKQAIIADDGFYLGEADNEQSEARCMAYLSGDANLIETVESGNDFHSVNIERFFGVPYAEVWDQVLGKTKNLDLRNLSKRVNHGTAYVMGAAVLLETMGIENVIKAQKLLGLPINWRAEKVCQYLLDRYHLAYPGVKGDYYEWVKAIVKLSQRLVSALGWTRHCFGDPSKNSRHFKALVAHVPQNLSVGIINRGFIRVFHEIQIPNWKDFRLKAQIHDSLLFQYRIGRLDLALATRKLIEETVPITDVKGITRNMKIPVALKGEHRVWSELKTVHVH